MAKRRTDPLVARIDALRERGVTMDEIAAAAGCHRSHLHRWLSARRAAPPRRLPLADRVAAAAASLEAAVRSNPNAP